MFIFWITNFHIDRDLSGLSYIFSFAVRFADHLRKSFGPLCFSFDLLPTQTKENEKCHIKVKQHFFFEY